MSDDLIVNSVQSQTTHVYGRTLNSARTHHFIIDGTRDPKEELTPVEVFLSAVSACCVQWVEQFAREEKVPLARLEVSITGTRSAAETNRFQLIEISVGSSGPTQSQLEDFVRRFKERCPLYRTVAASVEVRFAVSADGR
jgi:uncharacterized OsmC-like protein